MSKFEVIGIKETWELEHEFCSVVSKFTLSAKKSMKGGRSISGILVLVITSQDLTNLK